MYFKVEPSGCCERKGMVQIRYDFYLHPGDYGHKERRVKAPIMPEGGYQGPLKDDGSPESAKHYVNWLESLPRMWIDTPFHSHFFYFHPDDATEDYIRDVGRQLCREAFIKWKNGRTPNLRNPLIPWHMKNDPIRKALCNGKVSQVQSLQISEAVPMEAT